MIRRSEVADGEEQRLRRCLANVIALSSMPAVWLRSGEERVADSLADIVLHSLSLDFALVAASLASPADAITVFKSGDCVSNNEERTEIECAVSDWVTLGPERRPNTILLPKTGTRFNAICVPLGVVTNSGFLVGGTRRPDFPNDEERGVLAVAANQASVALRSETARRQVARSERLLTAQKGILEQIARGDELRAVLEAIAILVETQAEGAICSILLLDDKGRLRDGAGPSLPEAYRAAIDGVRIGPNVGSCGTAAFRRQPVIVEDIATDPLWASFRKFALEHGLRACWSTPVTVANGEILGSVAMYYRSPRRPGPGDLELTEVATHLAGIAIERVRTEDALRTSENLLRTIIDTEPECVKLVDRDGTLRMMNSAGLRMIEAARAEDVVGESVYGLITPEHRAAFEDFNQRIFAGESGSLHFQITGLAGTPRWMETHAVPLRDERGEITAHLAVTRDITDRRRDEEELARQTTELAQRDREKDEFLAMLAHELRNPLAPVLNAAQAIRARAGGDPLLQRQVEIISRQSSHMARLLDDLLDVSRITRNKIELRKQPLNLAAAIAQAVEACRPQMEQRGHRFNLQIPKEPLYVEADVTRVHQVLSNLLSNAAKFTDPGGTVLISLTRDANEGAIQVADSGAGIAPEALPRLFDLFYQADRSLSRSDSGLGIGLTMVRRLVELHGGSVSVSSEGLGAGSCFTVRLPLAEAVQESPKTSDGAPSHERRMRRVLIVDDNQDSAETLGDLVRLWGHEARTVHSGPQAIEVVPRFSPNIVLLDISMPGMNGFEAALELRRLPEGRDCCLVALTGYGREQDRNRTLAAGFDRHLTKPVDLKLLEDLLAGNPIP